MGNLLGENLDPFVLKQMRTRQLIHGSGVDSSRDPIKIKALNSSTSFIRLASAVNVDEAKLSSLGIDPTTNVGDGLARNNILFNGTSKLNATFSEEGFGNSSNPSEDVLAGLSNESRSGFSPDGKGSYELSEDYGRVPMAGITGAQIKALTRGSIKKATIDIKINSREQFDIIDLLYMRVGMTVCLEWGNSLYPVTVPQLGDNPTEVTQATELREILSTYITDPDNGFFSDSTEDPFKVLEYINIERQKNHGNYDALLGRITNYKWNYNADGSYSVTLTVISLGDIIESLKTNLSVDINTENFLAEAIKQLPAAGPSDSTTTSSKDINQLTSFFWVWKFINRGFSTDQTSIYPKDEIVNWFEDGYSYRTTSLENLNGATKYWIGNYMKTSLPGSNPGEVEVVTHTVHWYSIIATGEDDMLFDDGTYYYPSHGPYANGGKGGKRTTVSVIDGSTFKLLDMNEGGGSTTITFSGGDQGADAKIDWYNKSAGWVKEYAVGMVNAAEWIKWTDNQSNFDGDDLFGEVKFTYTVETTKSKIPSNLANLNLTDGVMLNNSKGNPVSTSVANRLAAKINEDTTGPHYYIRFKAFLDFLKESILPRVDLGFPSEEHKNNESIMNIDTDVDSNIMYSLPNHLSLDPRICIIRNDNFRSQQDKTWKYFTDGNGKGGLEEFSPIDGIQIEGAENNLFNVGKIMNIYLNFDFCLSSISNSADEEGNIGLYKLLSSITQGINVALGGINNLEPVIDETSNSIKILESSQIPGFINKDSNKIDLNIVGFTPEGEIYEAKPDSTTPTSTFVRKVNLETTVSPQLATIMSVGATAGGYVKGTDGSAFSKWNKGLTDRFKVNLLPGSVDSLPQPITGSNGLAVDLDEALNNYFVKYLSTNSQILGSSYDMTSKNLGYIENWDNEIIDRNVSVVSEFYRYLISSRTQRSLGSGVSGGTLGFLPFKMSFTMDGLSGIKIYNSLNINTRFLPKIYGDTLNFITTAVDHKIKTHDWETDITVMVVPRSTQEYNVIKDLEYEWGIAKAADLTTAENIIAIYATPEEEANPGQPSDDPIGENSTTLGTSPSTDTLNTPALKSDESVESVIKVGIDIIDSL